MEIKKETKNLGNLIFKMIEKKDAKEMIIKNHYSHKWNDGGFGLYNIGIFREEEPDKCLGVAVYGYMKNPKAKIYDHRNPRAMLIELNRMWIDDCLGKNAETLLISVSLKIIKKLNSNIVGVQSFADGRLGCGTIYKASNFKYYGYHKTKFLIHKRTGDISHEQNFTNSTTNQYLKYNADFIVGNLDCYEVKTYRYVYPLDKYLKMKFKEQSYPKYEKGMEKIEWTRDKYKIKERMKNIIDKL